MNGEGALMDNFNYKYYAASNKLRGVLPIVRDTLYNGALNSNTKLYRDITIQGSNVLAGAGSTTTLKATENIAINPVFGADEGADFAAYIPEEGPFIYDAIGNLIADEEEGVKISWTPYGKIREVKTHNDSVVVKFRYDGTGNRIEKRVEKYDTTLIARYVRDASGNVMSVYNDTSAIEQPIYGSARLGMYRGSVLEGHQTLGRRSYELSNHLGNVLAVITDNIGMNTADTVWGNVESSSDYYPFGMMMPGRSYSAEDYRYGFNGKEKDDKGELGETTYDYGFRIYNPRIGKFLSVDPLASDYPSWSPYPFAMNRPIDGLDLDGLEWYKPIVDWWNAPDELGVGDAYAAQFSVPAEHNVKKTNGQAVLWGIALAAHSYGEYKMYGTYDETYVKSGTKPVQTKVTKSNVRPSNTQPTKVKSENQGGEFLDDALRFTKPMKIAGREIIIDENLSPTLVKSLEDEGFKTRMFPKEVKDEAIIEYAKKNNAIVVTNNVKDFLKKDLDVIKVSENLKKNPSLIVEKMKNMVKNIEAGTTNLNNNNGVSLTNQ